MKAILTGLKLSGRLDGSKAGQRLWAAWQQLLALAGLAGVPQVGRLGVTVCSLLVCWLPLSCLSCGPGGGPAGGGLHCAAMRCLSTHLAPPSLTASHQVLWATFRPASTSLLPCQLTLAAGCTLAALEAAGRLPRALRGLWAATSAWTATALFMLQPVSQLVVNFTVG